MGAYDFCGWGEGGGRIFGVLAIKKRFRQILVSIQHATNKVSVEKLYFAQCKRIKYQQSVFGGARSLYFIAIIKISFRVRMILLVTVNLHAFV